MFLFSNNLVACLVCGGTWFKYDEDSSLFFLCYVLHRYKLKIICKTQFGFCSKIWNSFLASRLHHTVCSAKSNSRVIIDLKLKKKHHNRITSNFIFKSVDFYLIFCISRKISVLLIALSMSRLYNRLYLKSISRQNTHENLNFVYNVLAIFLQHIEKKLTWYFL